MAVAEMAVVRMKTQGQTVRQGVVRARMVRVLCCSVRHRGLAYGTYRGSSFRVASVLQSPPCNYPSHIPQTTITHPGHPSLLGTRRG
jgi:hypothetical protein